MARHTDLAYTKQENVTGGHVSYYLVVIHFDDGRPDIVVEIEDIIEALDMSFALGNVFKAAVRICKFRQDLGKPGSRPIYEAEKIKYYSERTVAVSVRRATRWSIRFRDRLHGWMHKNDASDGLNLKIVIRDPKRLDPYEFVIKDFIDALKARPSEASVLHHVLMTALLRITAGSSAKAELAEAKALLVSATEVEAFERNVVNSR